MHNNYFFYELRGYKTRILRSRAFLLDKFLPIEVEHKKEFE